MQDKEVGVEEFVQVPVPKRLVPQVYRLLAQLTDRSDASVDSSFEDERQGADVLPGTDGDRQRIDLRYRLLAEYLRRNEEPFIRLSLAQIEEICNGELPASAYKHRAWWANSRSHSHAHAWLSADYKVVRVEVDRTTEILAITFRRV